MDKVIISKDLQFDPSASVYDVEAAESLQGQQGEVLTKNTMGETLVQFDNKSLGQYWISDHFVEQVA